MNEYNNITITEIEAMLGAQADIFFQSDIGRYVAGVAKQEQDAALLELLDVEPSDINKVRELQNKANVATLALRWLNDALITGRQARETLDSRGD